MITICPENSFIQRVEIQGSQATFVIEGKNHVYNVTDNDIAFITSGNRLGTWYHKNLRGKSIK
jgi:hypothetical protein